MGIINSDSTVEDVFTYHAPTEDQKQFYRDLRDGAKAFAKLIRQCTPECADQQAALRKLRECVMTANAAIALKGRI